MEPSGERKALLREIVADSYLPAAGPVHPPASRSRPESSHPNQLNLFSCFLTGADGISMGALAHSGPVVGVLRRGMGITSL